MGSSVILPPAGQPKEGPDTTFATAARPTVVTFHFEDLNPPSNLYINRDDVLVVNIGNSLVGVAVNIQGKILLPVGPFSGQPDVPQPDPLQDERVRYGFVQPFVFQQIPTSDRHFNSQTYQLWEGYLLSLSCSVPVTTGLKRGQCYVSVGLQRSASSPFRDHNLLSDYITQNADMGWPTGRTLHPTEGPGFINVISVANPGAGADWAAQVVPFGTRWRPICWSGNFVSSATVANRVVRDQIIASGQVSFQGSPNQVIPASTTAQVTASPTVPTVVANVADVQVNLPPAEILRSGDSIGANTLNLQAGDQWSNVRVTVEEWLDP